ncbi:hypothetical protein [Paractinoplanes globisporus]|uniref:Uncharacterized protein n=1 Tax=Paractinoplanes globisporus TaxID=113565 RepID=A0ABW6WU11_9ACTN|nr:hypothetical protein [Actinoplanes globisporus]
MPEMTEAERVWEAWFEAYARLRDGHDAPCPDGDGGRLHLTYYGRPGSRIGSVTVWCDLGRNGIFLDRVGIPETVVPLPFDATPEQRASAIPEIRLIPTAMYSPD